MAATMHPEKLTCAGAHGVSEMQNAPQTKAIWSEGRRVVPRCVVQAAGGVAYLAVAPIRSTIAATAAAAAWPSP